MRVNFQVKWEKINVGSSHKFLLGLYSLHRVLGFCLFCKSGMEKEGKNQGQPIIIFKRYSDLLHPFHLFQIK